MSGTTQTTNMMRLINTYTEEFFTEHGSKASEMWDSQENQTKLRRYLNRHNNESEDDDVYNSDFDLNDTSYLTHTKDKAAEEFYKTPFFAFCKLHLKTVMREKPNATKKILREELVRMWKDEWVGCYAEIENNA